MSALTGFAWLLSFQTVGELLSRGLSLPLPGPVVGMVALLVALNSRRVREPVAATADFLLSHLSLLFVPVAVGVMSYLSVLAQYGFRLMLVLAVSTWIGLGVTVLLLHTMSKASDAELR